MQRRRQTTVRQPRNMELRTVTSERWRVQKESLKNANSKSKAYRGPQSSRFQESDRRVCEFVTEKGMKACPLPELSSSWKHLTLLRSLTYPPPSLKSASDGAEGSCAVVAMHYGAEPAFPSTCPRTLERCCNLSIKNFFKQSQFWLSESFSED